METRGENYTPFAAWKGLRVNKTLVCVSSGCARIRLDVGRVGRPLQVAQQFARVPPCLEMSEERDAN